MATARWSRSGSVRTPSLRSDWRDNQIAEGASNPSINPMNITQFSSTFFLLLSLLSIASAAEPKPVEQLLKETEVSAGSIEGTPRECVAQILALIEARRGAGDIFVTVRTRRLFEGLDSAVRRSRVLRVPGEDGDAYAALAEIAKLSGWTMKLGRSSIDFLPDMTESEVRAERVRNQLESIQIGEFVYRDAYPLDLLVQFRQRVARAGFKVPVMIANAPARPVLAGSDDKTSIDLVGADALDVLNRIVALSAWHYRIEHAGLVVYTYPKMQSPLNADESEEAARGETPAVEPEGRSK